MKEKNKAFVAPKNVAKLLIFCRDSRISAWHLGRHNIYQKSHYVIRKAADAPLMAEHKHVLLQRDAPAIVEIRYNSEDDLKSFLNASITYPSLTSGTELTFEDLTPLRAHRIFKTLWFMGVPPKAFFYNICKNLLGLLKGKDAVLRISSNSWDLRELCYKIAVEVSTLFPEQKFDYDEYDVELFLREYEDHGKRLLVTYVSKGRELLSA